MIVGITGKKGAGKDTAGEYLVSEFGFTRVGFADLLKESAAALFDIPPEKWNEWKNLPSYKVMIVGPSFPGARDIKTHSILTSREFLQRYGTEAHRDVFGYNFWVDQAMKSLEPGRNYVFTDVRFDNEAEAVKNSIEGVIISIYRHDVEDLDTHASENPIDFNLIDHEIDNDWEIVNLHDDLRELMVEEYGLSPVR